MQRQGLAAKRCASRMLQKIFRDLSVMFFLT